MRHDEDAKTANLSAAMGKKSVVGLRKGCR